MPSTWDQESRQPWKRLGTSKDYWERQRIIARSNNPNDLLLGYSAEGNIPYAINPSLLQSHAHIVGATNVGKSYFLEGLIKQLIMAGHGVCLIDPHGDLFNRILSFCAYLDRQEPARNLASRVVPFDIAETKSIMGFNPIQRNARVMTYQVVALMEAIRKCWGQTTFNETPRLARWLYNTSHAVIEGQVTFLQMYNMVNPGFDPYRVAITSRLKDERMKAEWDLLAQLSLEKREERVESCLNRIKPFVNHEMLRLILGQYTKTFNFPSVLEGQKIFLVNLSRRGAISTDNQAMLGTLLVNELLSAAFARPQKKRTPFYLVIDEFQHFVTKDICEILDGGRKFGLHLILAHQHLHQLKEKDPEVYYSTLTNARMKAVFGGLIDEDLEVLAKELYSGEFNPYLVKDEIWQEKYEPVETSRTVRTNSGARTIGSAQAEISHLSLTTGEVRIPGSDFWSASEIQSTSKSEASGTSRSTSEQSSENVAWSESEVPFYEYHKYRELSSRTFVSLEEQLYLKKSQMKGQATQHLSLLLPGRKVEVLKAPTLTSFDDKVSDAFLEEFKEKCFTNAGCFKTPKEVQKEMNELEETLLLEQRSSIELDTRKRKTNTRAARAKGGSVLDELLGKG